MGDAREIELQWANGVIEIRECTTDLPPDIFVTARSNRPEDGNARFQLHSETMRAGQRWVYREVA